ncbi:SGNH/GDSL hydrolase family protein [Burkholderia cepacia]|uniref:SGNH/GDSL hydrolase family protein n=1 Tax=Burkholderia cepacia TaxID=292 RepID=UPI0007572FD1|nr:SGNH/GDSL hydrolase family protein [Burkholderia cepacia]KVU58814.1 hypothetical protein WK70_13070 [Burkholderia cepacia]
MVKASLCVFLGMLVVSFSGCGGGDGSSAYASTPATQRQQAVLVEAYGDSTTLGAQTIDGVLTTTQNSEPTQLQALLQQRFGTSVTVKNEGVGGTQAFQLLSGTDGKHPEWKVQMEQSKAQVVLLNFALNDFYYWKAPQPGVYEASPSEYAKILGYLIQTARDAGKIVVLQEPNPTCKQPDPGTIIQYVEALRSEAALQNAPLVAQFEFDQTVPDWQSMLTDCAHPNDQLYGIKAKQTFTVIEPIVKSIIDR